jgi:competence protein ComEA
MNGLLAILLSLLVTFAFSSAMAAAPADKDKAATEETVKGQAATEEKEATASFKIDVNTADVAELTRIPGIGPKTAEAIVAYRKDVGQFKKLEDLIEVKGIGPKKLETIRPFLANI